MGKTVLLSGGSGGIGKATACYFAERGYHVYEISRHGKDGDGITHITADVTDISSLTSAIERVEAESGALDLLICNAGIGISGAVEFTAPEDARRLMDVNFFGVFHLVQAALPLLRKSESPMIINISSLASPIPIPFQAFYSASKAAVTAFSMALSNELRPFGIRVSALLPGDTATGFTDARIKSEDGDSLYGDTIRRAVGAMEQDERHGMKPRQLAKKIWSISTKKHPRAFYTAGFKNHLFLFLQKILPATLCNRIVGSLYR